MPMYIHFSQHFHSFASTLWRCSMLFDALCFWARHRISRTSFMFTLNMQVQHKYCHSQKQPPTTKILIAWLIAFSCTGHVNLMLEMLRAFNCITSIPQQVGKCWKCLFPSPIAAIVLGDFASPSLQWAGPWGDAGLVPARKKTEIAWVCLSSLVKMYSKSLQSLWNLSPSTPETQETNVQSLLWTSLGFP